MMMIEKTVGFEEIVTDYHASCLAFALACAGERKRRTQELGYQLVDCFSLIKSRSFCIVSFEDGPSCCVCCLIPCFWAFYSGMQKIIVELMDKNDKDQNSLTEMMKTRWKLQTHGKPTIMVSEPTLKKAHYFEGLSDSKI